MGEPIDQFGMQKIIDDYRSDMSRWIAEEFRVMNAQSIPISNFQISPSPSNHHSPGNFQIYDPPLHQPPPHFSFQPIHPPPDLPPPFPPFITTNTQSATPYYPPMYPQNYYPEPSYNPYYQPQCSYTDNPYYQGPITNSSYTPTYCPEYYHYSDPTNSSNQFSSPYYAPGINQTPTNSILLVHELLELESPMDQFKEDNQEGSMEEYVSDFYCPTSSPMTALDGQNHEAQLLFDEMPQRGVESCREHIGPKKADVLQEGEDEFEQTIGEVHSPATTVRSANDPQFRTSPLSFESPPVSSFLSLAPPQDPLPFEYSTVAGHRKSMEFFDVEIINVLYTQNLFDIIPQPLVCYHSKPISDLSPHVPYNHYFSLNFPPPRPPSQPPDAFPVREISLMPSHKHAIKLFNRYTSGNSVPSVDVFAGVLTECSEKFELEMDYRVFRHLLDSYVKAEVLVDVYLYIALWSEWQPPKSESTTISVFMQWNCDWAKISSILVGIYASRESESVGNISGCHICGFKMLCDEASLGKTLITISLILNMQSMLADQEMIWNWKTTMNPILYGLLILKYNKMPNECRVGMVFLGVTCENFGRNHFFMGHYFSCWLHKSCKSQGVPEEAANTLIQFKAFVGGSVDVLETVMHLTHSPSWLWWIVMKASLFKDFQEDMHLWCKLESFFLESKLEDKLDFKRAGMMRPGQGYTLLQINKKYMCSQTPVIGSDLSCLLYKGRVVKKRGYERIDMLFPSLVIRFSPVG